jgi:alkylated DNA repair protein (DNA oxidative demethylase)
MPADLFPETQVPVGLTYLPGFALAEEAALLDAVATIAAAAPFRQMATPGGKLMSVAMTSCGDAGWITDRRGYRYSAIDPQTGAAWPPIPAMFRDLAMRAATNGGFENFIPDACLINRYIPGAKMTLHSDADERDFSAPIVSVSLGLPAVFQWGGAKRGDKITRLPLTSGDVVVWGGIARRHYHGILPLRDGEHSLTGRSRINLTFRLAL